ncbi:MAG: elongation factor G [Chloroflexota bacterium]
MKQHGTEQVRNVGLFSHGGAGKTTLSEALLFNSGTINRMGQVEEGTTVSDYDPEETKRRISVQLTILPFEWKDYKINLIDTPGYADFIGEVREAIRVVDTAVILVDAVSGVEVGTETMWRAASEYDLPRVVVITKMDRENAEFRRTVEQLRDRFGAKLVPIQMPVGSQTNFQGVIDLLSRKAYTGPRPTATEPAADLAGEMATLREQMVESIAETDDKLINKYLEGEEIGDDDLKAALRRAVVNGQLVPIVCAAAGGSLGVAPILDVITDYLPSPADRGSVTATDPMANTEVEIEPSGNQPLLAFVFKTAADPFVGKLTYLRVYSGTMTSNSQVYNANRGREERIGQLYTIRAKSQEPTESLIAGEIGAVAKLQETTTGDTLCQRDRVLRLQPSTFPQPSFAVAISPKTKADLDKLGSALQRLVEEDPTIQVRKDADTNEMVLSGMGESHVDVATERMNRKFGVAVETAVPKVPYKETIRSSTRAEYKHKKQTGGHGQYGHVFLQLEPLPSGGGFEFADKVVGGSVPRNFIPAVEKGVRESLGEGVLAGYQVVDLKVTLVDGSYHPVDSSEMAFKIASSQAFKKGVEQAKPVLLEPIVNLTVTVPESSMGDVMSDLNSKRCRVLGMDTSDDSSVIRAVGPLSELRTYATDLRSLTGGRGTYSLEFDHYEEVPAHLTANIVAEAKKEREAK